MHNLIVTDVFGKTTAVEMFASALSVTTKVVDPYNSRNMNFQNEKEAYTYFKTEVGLDKYAENLVEEIQLYPNNISTLIGFSVGASAIWNVSSQTGLSNISRAYCFYGSQIRNNKNVSPIFPVHLIFPSSEEHFSIPKLITSLTGREGVQVVQTNYLHGFMNIHSNNFDQDGYDHFLKLLCQIGDLTNNGSL